MSDNKVFIGVDPGINGGIAVLAPGKGLIIKTIPMPLSDKGKWEFLLPYSMGGIAPVRKPDTYSVFAVIEQQSPRPTGYKDKKTGAYVSTILKSTCLLWGNYCTLRGMLTAASIAYEEVPPKRWQEGLGIPARHKDETESVWKARLKTRAEQLYPNHHITLSISDALLLATYARMLSSTREGG
jgi:hypothetical protein